MVEYWLEQETGTGEEKAIVKVKTVKDKAEAIKDKGMGQNYFHTCYHDELDFEGQGEPCKRVKI